MQKRRLDVLPILMRWHRFMVMRMHLLWSNWSQKLLHSTEIIMHCNLLIGKSRKVCICIVLSCTYVCSMRSLADLDTSIVPPLHSIDYPCNLHVLTYAMFTSPRLHKLCNAHLPVWIRSVSSTYSVLYIIYVYNNIFYIAYNICT